MRAFVSLLFELGEVFYFDWSEDGLVVGEIYCRLQVSRMKLCASRAFWLAGYSRQGGAMQLQCAYAQLFDLLSLLYEQITMMIQMKLDFVEWSRVFGHAKMITVLLDRLTQHGHILETGNEAHRLLHSSSTAKKRVKAREQFRMQAAAECRG